MFKFKIYQAFIITIFSTLCIWGQGYIIEIGGQKFTKTEIQNLAEVNDYKFPSEVIEKLMRTAVIDNIGRKEFPAGTNKENALYKKIFNCDIESDQEFSNAFDLLQLQMESSARLAFFIIC